MPDILAAIREFVGCESVKGVLIFLASCRSPPGCPVETSDSGGSRRFPSIRSRR